MRIFQQFLPSLLMALFSLLSSAQAIAANNLDNIQDARVLSITQGSDYKEEGTTWHNREATAEVNEAAHAGNIAVKSVWFKWVADTSSTVSIYTTGSNFDTVLAVYTALGLQTQTATVENDDEAIGTIATSKVSFNPTIGVTYYIAVDGFAGATGDISLRLTRASQFVTGIITLPQAYTHSSPEEFWVYLETSDGSVLNVEDRIAIWFDSNSSNDRHFRIPLLGNESMILSVGCFDCDGGKHYLPTFFGAHGTSTAYRSKGSLLNPAASYVSNITMISSAFYLKAAFRLLDGIVAESGKYYSFAITAINTAVPNDKTIFFTYAVITPGNSTDDITLYLPGSTVADQFDIKVECVSPDACREYEAREYLINPVANIHKLSYQQNAYRYPGNTGVDNLGTLDLLPAIPLTFFPIKSKNGKVVIIGF